MQLTATYSPDDNKLRLYASSRLDADTYARVKAAGFKWAPKQDLFVAPMWTPGRADLLMELCGDIGDEDTGLIDRAEERAERFSDYRERRAADAETARRAVDTIADGIPMGQPILVGHHSERHARRDAERIENGMRKAIRMWDTAQYWTARAAGALRHAKYKERPDVRARRIKTIEADRRKQERIIQHADRFGAAWSREDLTIEQGTAIANHDGGYWAAAFDFRRPTGEVYHTGPCSLWDALTRQGIPLADVRTKALANHAATKASAERWIAHYDNRLTYERAMLADAGGTVAQRTGPEKGGACHCWCTARGRGMWSSIQKVNRVSVTVLDNWGNGGRDFTRTVPFDQLTGVMSRADVDAARSAGRVVGETPRGFCLLDESPTPTQPSPPTTQPERPDPNADAATFDAMRASLRAGVQVVTAPQLFPTPPDVAHQIIDLADIQPGHRVLEPSAGTGALLGAMGGRMFGADVKYGRVHAVEISGALCPKLRADFPLTVIHQADFLAMDADDFGGTFDRIVMNPPFRNADDIRHIQHARRMLAPGGRLVAVCANGPRQQDQLRPIASDWIDLPAGTFAGTDVRAVVLVLDAEPLPAPADAGHDHGFTLEPPL